MEADGLSKKKALKKLKKLKKRKVPPVEKLEDACDMPELQPASETSAKAKRKAEKKARAAESGLAIGESKDSSEVLLNGSVAGHASRKKKQRREKEARTEEAHGGLIARVVQQPAASDLAQVGSREAAEAGERIKKKFYREHPDVTALTPSAVASWQAERAIAVENSDLRPVQQFSQTGLAEEFLHAARTFTSPSPIQAQCLPIALSGRDLVGIAATGSGKTLAFGLPCLRHIHARQGKGSGSVRQPQALMLSPTRELAQQIAAVMTEAGERCGVKTLCVYGGVPKQPQAKALRKGVHIIVATPGRLEDLMNDGACQLNGVSYLVLDEADRMLDLGFEPHIRAIAGQTRADRQTLMFSATWPSEVQKLAMEYLANPARVTIGSQDLSASHSVQQIVEVIEPADRPKRLLELLKRYHSSRKNRVLVFVLYKREAGTVEAALQGAGWKAASIHGDINQHQRTRAVEQFKTGKMPLLIATDVAARGLDIPDVEVVINYSFPLTTEDYVHRIGRTGRAGKSGIAHTFFSGATDKARSGELINVLKEASQPVPPELLAFGVTTKKKESKLYGAHFKEIDHSQKATKIVFDD